MPRQPSRFAGLIAPHWNWRAKGAEHRNTPGMYAVIIENEARGFSLALDATAEDAWALMEVLKALYQEWSLEHLKRDA